MRASGWANLTPSSRQLWLLSCMALRELAAVQSPHVAEQSRRRLAATRWGSVALSFQEHRHRISSQIRYGVDERSYKTTMWPNPTPSCRGKLEGAVGSEAALDDLLGVGA
jgi:hypothetical protein